MKDFVFGLSVKKVSKVFDWVVGVVFVFVFG